MNRLAINGTVGSASDEVLGGGCRNEAAASPDHQRVVDC